ncbi:MAG TPA: hypothetical protein VI233_15650 [Puia sp.]
MDELEKMAAYSRGVEDGRNAEKSDKAFAEFIDSVFRLLGNGIFLILLFFPSLFASYLLLEKYRISGSLKGWNYFWALIATIVVIEILVLSIRALSRFLRKRRNWWWILPQTIYFLYCFAFPTLISQSIIWLVFKPAHKSPTTTFTLISWLIGLVLGGFYYLRCEGISRAIYRR